METAWLHSSFSIVIGGKNRMTLTPAGNNNKPFSSQALIKMLASTVVSTPIRNLALALPLQLKRFASRLLVDSLEK